MGKRKPRPWPDPPNPLALPVIDITRIFPSTKVKSARGRGEDALENNWSVHAK